MAHSGRAGTGPGPEKTAQVAAGTPHRRHPAAVVPRPPERAAGPPRGTAQAVAEREAELPYPQDLGTSPNQDQQDPGGRHPGPPPQGAQPTGPRTARGWGQAGPGTQTATRHGARPGSNARAAGKTLRRSGLIKPCRTDREAPIGGSHQLKKVTCCSLKMPRAYGT